jgi:hypothetical protein
MTRLGIFVCVLALSFSLGALLSGCTTQSKARAEARAAYFAGQNAALVRNAAQGNRVLVIGQVKNHEIDWTNGLTLARAIVAANYAGLGDPTEIILTRQGRNTIVNPQDLLNGHDVPLQPGDTITIREPPKP